MTKKELFIKVQNLSLNEEEIDRFPSEIDELSLILSRELCEEISKILPSISLSLTQWTRFQAILQTKLSYAIRRTKFTPPEIPNQIEIQRHQQRPISQGYDLGKGYVTLGTKILYYPSRERVISGIVTNLTQDGDVTIQPDSEPQRRFTTKWRYVVPR